jgi:antitoxin CptB
MTEPSLSDPLDTRRRRARVRAWHRGTREMDLLLGRFADAHMADLSAADLAAFEALLEAPDTDLFCWITGSAPVADGFDGPVFRAIVAFHHEHRAGEGAR